MKEAFNKIFNAIKDTPVRVWHLILTYAFLIFLLVLIYQKLTYTYITAEFKELRPIHQRISVFYKGYKIGKVLYIKPSDDFKTTYMKIALFHKKNLKLPKNSVIKLQREKEKWRKKDYIDIIYPENPTESYLENGDLVLGKSTVDIETFLSSQEPETLENIRQNMEKTSEDLQGAVEALRDLITSLNEIANENRENIDTAFKNMANTSRNINNLTGKFNRSIRQKRLDESVLNIDTAILNTKNSTIELEKLSKRINNMTNSINGTMPTVTTGITDTGCIIKNLNEITCGVSNTLKKRFGGLRLIFGKTIDEECSGCAKCGECGN